MEYDVDYSAGHPTNLGAAKGAIRYLGTPSSNKNLTPAEAAGLSVNGFEILGVYEGSANWMLGGFSAGIAAAQAVEADISRCALPSGITVYFACDFQPTAGQLPACLAALDGAAHVIGKTRVGAYGFAALISAAMAGGHASYYWQCGSRAQLVPGVCLYQHNNDTTTVGGITADIDEILLPDYGQTSTGKDDLFMALSDAQQAELFDYVRCIYQQLAGDGATGQMPAPGSYPGWQSRVPGSDVKLSLVDYVRAVDARTYNDAEAVQPAIQTTIAGLKAAVAAPAAVDAATLNAAVSAALTASGWTAPPTATDVAAAVINALRAAVAELPAAATTGKAA